MRARRSAFTLVELMMVITIMGIIIALILKAASGGIRRAEEKATISLIAKLEAALTDRVDAIAGNTPEPNATHKLLASIWPNSSFRIDSLPRAQVISHYDNMRAELPDVFVVQSTLSASPAPGTYLLNFGGQPFPLGSTSAANYVLPLGAAVPLNQGGDWDSINIPIMPAGTGIYGASYAAAAGIYQQLGYGPKGTNGSDDDQNGFVDDASEGVIGLDATQITDINKRLAKHKHKTARAEMLYAMLIEGTGPLGSSFNREDFSNREVADTDGDGLMEFIDAWGEPIQFFRWPILYRSDTQRGFPDLVKISQDQANSAPIGPYLSVYESRESNPLDPSQLLLSPAWWTQTYNNSTPLGSGDASSNASGAAITFQAYFHTLIDPVAASAGGSGLSTSNTTVNTYWDRSISPNASYGKIYSRRSYYSRFLVLSGGPDKIPGVAQLGVNYQNLDERGSFPQPGGGYASPRDSSGAAVPATVANVVTIENQAGRVDPNRTGAYLGVSLSSGRNDTNTFLEEAGNDDISSQNIHALGGPLQ